MINVWNSFNCAWGQRNKIKIYFRKYRKTTTKSSGKKALAALQKQTDATAMASKISNWSSKLEIFRQGRRVLQRRPKIEKILPHWDLSTIKEVIDRFELVLSYRDRRPAKNWRDYDKTIVHSSKYRRNRSHVVFMHHNNSKHAIAISRKYLNYIYCKEIKH